MEDVKTGEWIPLGHRSGFLKHPYSEDFKCSICGYEAYTVFSGPPMRCPKCRGQMSNGDPWLENLQIEIDWDGKS